MRVEEMKAKLYLALCNVERRYETVYPKLLFLEDPKCLRTKEKIAKGELALAPVVPMRAITTRAPTTAGSAVDFGVLLAPPEVAKPIHFYAPKPQTIPKADAIESWIVPYAWVGDTHEEEEANMHQIKVKEEFCGVTFSVPVLVNKAIIPKYEKVRMYVFDPKAKAAPAAGTGPAPKRARVT